MQKYVGDALLNSILKCQQEQIPGADSVALSPGKDALSSVGEYFSKCFSPFLVKEGAGQEENSLGRSRSVRTGV